MSAMKTAATPATPMQAMPHIPHEKIAMRAYEKWCKRGCPHGSDAKDWHEAETELRAEMSRMAAASARK